MNSRRTPSNASSSVRNSPVVHRQQQAVTQALRQRPPSTLGVVPAPTPPILESPLVAQSLDRPGMSSVSRYSSNLKVLRRRDPSIISIFDQFSHVCVYHHNGDKWEKQGYEGSMFLYERDAYPPYGFYILNRMNMADYNQRLYPEDNISVHGRYLMMRSYPTWTARRLESVLQSSVREGKPIPDKFSLAWDLHNTDADIRDADKGAGVTVGLWIFAHDSTDSMMDVMVRLHSYIKQNLPYPEEFKYGPDHPPPPNLIPRIASVPIKEGGAQAQSVDRAVHSSSTKPATPAHSLLNGLMNGNIAGGTSELDKLFAKLNPPSIASSMPATDNTLTVDSLFASINNSQKPQSPVAPANGPTTTGLALLNSIFASATPTSQQSTASTSAAASLSTSLTASSLSPKSVRPNPRATHNPANPEPESIIIYSPTPTPSALPQILNQDVISTLLGLPSRSSSAAPTTTSSSTRTSDSSSTRRSGREGGDEDDGGYSSDGGHSESSTVLDRLPVGRGDIVNGDVTPRVPTNGHVYDRPSSSSRLHSFVYPNKKVVPPTSAIVPPFTTNNLPNAHNSGTITNGTHLPATFSTGAELWDNHTGSDRFTVDNGDDDEIMELDFADTRALSDIDAYRKAKAQHTNGANKAGLPNGRSAVKQPQPPQPHSREGSSDASMRSAASVKEKRAKKRAGKEKLAELDHSVAARVDVNGDVLDVPEAFANSLQRQPHLRAAAATSTPSPIASLPPSAVSSTDPAIISISSLLKIAQQPQSYAPPQTSRPLVAAATVNGHTKVDDGPGSRVNKALVKESILAAAAGKLDKQAKLERNDFVREVLTLIHTDKSFVNTLYQDYVSRC